MPTYCKYWTLIRLTTNGSGQSQELSEAKTLIQQLRPQAQANEPVEDDRALQQQLCQYLNSKGSTNSQSITELDFHSPAGQSLRCYISHQIFQVCQKLVDQFGANYGFTLTNLLPVVLDDDGSPNSITYQPRSYKILLSFDPQVASLSTWSSRLTRSDDELNATLATEGLLLISDWALLNDARPSSLRKTLSVFHQLSPSEVEASLELLEAYHTVYRQARILQGQKGRCIAPSEKQCHAIAAQLSQAPSPKATLKALLLLAQQIREYNIARKQGMPKGVSLDAPETMELANTPTDDEDKSFWAEQCQTYQAQLSACLSHAVTDVIEQRLQTLHTKKSDKRQSYLTALRLFYCEGYSMGKLASHIGLQKQYQVTRLLNLKQMQGDIRHGAIACLQANLRHQFAPLMSPEQLEHLDHNLEQYLSPAIDQLIQSETNRAQTPGQYRQENSRLAIEICQVLQSVLPQQQKEPQRPGSEQKS